MKKRSKGPPSKPDVKLPGDVTFPLNSFSLTVSRIGGDVERSCIDSLHTYLASVCTQSLLSFESGSKKHNLHIQGVFSILFPKSPQCVIQLKRILKTHLPSGGRGYKIMLKPFAPTQTFSAMLGYCTKDQGRPHYQTRNHNVTLEVRGLHINNFRYQIYTRSYPLAVGTMMLPELVMMITRQ